jgi:nicotinamidase-related amidase
MRALIIVDMLNDFVTGKLARERARRIIPNISRRTGWKAWIISNGCSAPG